MITVTVPRPKNVTDLDTKMFDEATEAIKELARKVNIDRLYANEYQRLAMRTCSVTDDEEEMLYHAVFGLNSEAGEVAGIFQKHFQGHEVKREHLLKELGDCCWMIAEACTALDATLEEVMQTNIDKLKARYPEGFDPEKSLHRKEGDI